MHMCSLWLPVLMRSTSTAFHQTISIEHERSSYREVSRALLGSSALRLAIIVAKLNPAALYGYKVFILSAETMHRLEKIGANLISPCWRSRRPAVHLLIAGLSSFPSAVQAWRL